MLQSLQVHNFALIEDAQVEFTRGLNIFTGETGAGKSILVDAFGIVLGGRASTSLSVPARMNSASRPCSTRRGTRG